MKRSERVASLILKNVAGIIMKDIKDERGKWVSITFCEMSKDLKRATLYYLNIAEKLSLEEAGLFLEEKNKEIRHYLGEKIVLKYLPELRFIPDNSPIIEHLIESIHSDK